MRKIVFTAPVILTLIISVAAATVPFFRSVADGGSVTNLETVDLGDYTQIYNHFYAHQWRDEEGVFHGNVELYLKGYLTETFDWMGWTLERKIPVQVTVFSNSMSCDGPGDVFEASNVHCSGSGRMVLRVRGSSTIRHNVEALEYDVDPVGDVVQVMGGSQAGMDDYFSVSDMTLESFRFLE